MAISSIDYLEFHDPLHPWTDRHGEARNPAGRLARNPAADRGLRVDARGASSEAPGTVAGCARHRIAHRRRRLLRPLAARAGAAPGPRRLAGAPRRSERPSAGLSLDIARAPALARPA